MQNHLDTKALSLYVIHFLQPVISSVLWGTTLTLHREPSVNWWHVIYFCIYMLCRHDQSEHLWSVFLFVSPHIASLHFHSPLALLTGLLWFSMPLFYSLHLCSLFFPPHPSHPMFFSFISHFPLSVVTLIYVRLSLKMLSVARDRRAKPEQDRTDLIENYRQGKQGGKWCWIFS